jgi:hypothetical protein
MFVAQLIVDRGSPALDSEDWGKFEFASPPSPADRIMVVHEGAENFLTVLCVHHQPCPAGTGEKPSAEVVAKWTGSTPKLR